MFKVIVTDIEPLSTPRIPASVLTNVTNSTVSPDRLNRWIPPVNSKLSSLPKGTGACSILLGEPLDVDRLATKQRELRVFKMSVVLRELAVEFYRQVGNVRSDFADDDYSSSRSYYYNKFLKANVPLLQDFLDIGCPPKSTSSLDANQVLTLVNPDQVLATANKDVHDITYDDIFTALEILKKENPAGAEAWEQLVGVLTDRTDAAEWKGDVGEVKDDFLVKRKRMVTHQIRKKSSEFDAKRMDEKESERYAKLEKKGRVVSLESLKRANKTLAFTLAFTLGVPLCMLVGVVAVLAIKVDRRLTKGGM